MAETRTGLCVLITHASIRDWSGSELYVRDVAVELIWRGHKPIVSSPRLGELADVLRPRSIPVVDDLDSIGVKPDLIHGQHHLETMTAVTHIPGSPTVFFCHGWLPWEETSPLHPRIVQYVTFSDAPHRLPHVMLGPLRPDAGASANASAALAGAFPRDSL
jgi:hypothetical protein